VSRDVIAAFFAGVASILGAGFTMRRVRKGERQRCAERIAELRESYDRGIDKGLHMSERHDA